MAVFKNKKQKTLTVDENTLSYQTFGEGKTILIVNAAGQSMALWDPTLALLSESYHIVTFNTLFRGNDKEEVYYYGDNYVDTYCDMVKAILEAESLQKVTMLSWCSGAKLSLEFAYAYGDYVDALVMLAPSFAGMDEFGKMETPNEADLIAMCKAVDKDPSICTMAVEMFKGIRLKQQADPNNTLSKELLDFVYYPLTDPFTLKQLSARISKFSIHDTTKLFSEIEKPTLLISASHDTSTSSLRAKKYCAKLKDVQCLEIEKADHYINYKHAVLVSDAIGKFMCESKMVAEKPVDNSRI